MKNNLVHIILKPDGLENPEIREFLLDLIFEIRMELIQSYPWYLGTEEFEFLRRDSLNKEYIEMVKSYYINKIHEVFRLSIKKIPKYNLEFRLKFLKKSMREKYAKNFFINAIHVPDIDEIETENTYFIKIL